MAVLCHQVTQTGITGMVHQVCRQNQFGTPCCLIDAPQGPHRPLNAPLWFYGIAKKPSVKADLAI